MSMSMMRITTKSLTRIMSKMRDPHQRLRATGTYCHLYARTHTYISSRTQSYTTTDTVSETDTLTVCIDWLEDTFQSMAKSSLEVCSAST